MKLTDLHPCFVGAGGEGISNKDGSPVPKRTGIGVSFDCPCSCGEHCFVAFTNPIDGGAPCISDKQPTWERTGDAFETLTLAPSILRMTGCRWHGYIRNGEIETV